MCVCICMSRRSKSERRSPTSEPGTTQSPLHMGTGGLSELAGTADLAAAEPINAADFFGTVRSCLAAREAATIEL